MSASEVMAQRVVLVDKLTRLDRQLEMMYGQAPTRSLAAEIRALFPIRRAIVRELSAVGYEAWPMPGDEKETKVS